LENEDLYTIVAMAVGTMFLFLTLLTFVLCRRRQNVNNTALVNLCISLFLAHLLYLLKTGFLKAISANKLACAVVAGVLHFLYVSSFLWMLGDAVLVFISVKNLTKIRSGPKKVLGWKSLTVIGYAIPLVVVGVAAGVMPNGYDTTECWLSETLDFHWSIYGPLLATAILNMILFICTFIIVIFTLKGLNSEILQRAQTQADKKLILSVLFKTMAQFFIVGCPWILNFLNSSRVMYFIFIFLVSQQGTFIFLVHCVLNQEVSHSHKRYSHPDLCV
ncbi:hypothetical protein NFI96_029670, partial [Prochilodus magdalenae]